MTKVNLLTIHYGKCYGAVMQTFATCRMLEQAGHVVRVINLINPSQKEIGRVSTTGWIVSENFSSGFSRKSIFRNLQIKHILLRTSIYLNRMLLL